MKNNKWPVHDHCVRLTCRRILRKTRDKSQTRWQQKAEVTFGNAVRKLCFFAKQCIHRIREIRRKGKKTVFLLGKKYRIIQWFHAFYCGNRLIIWVCFLFQATAGIPTKKIGIYLTMAPPKERPYPMTIVTLASAKVQDLIGLICWQYGVEGRQPPLKYVSFLM